MFFGIADGFAVGGDYRTSPFFSGRIVKAELEVTASSRGDDLVFVGVKVSVGDRFAGEGGGQVVAGREGV